MDAVDWSGLGFIAALVVGCIGYLSRQLHRVDDRLRAELGSRFGAVDDRFDGVDDRFDRVEARLDRLDERYVRHLEQHAAGHPV